jgi:ATP-binding cassette subfamily C protein LapB
MNALLPALQRLAFLQRQSLDKHALLATLESHKPADTTPLQTLRHLKQQLNWTSVQWLNNQHTDPSALPCLAVDHQGEWRVVKSFNAQAQWVFEGADGETTHHSLGQFALAKINFRMPFDRSSSPVWRLIKLEILKHKGTLLDAGLNGVMLNVLALGISFYSMQIYDRVVPTGASATLWVLSLGALGAIGFEWLARTLRSHQNEKIIEAVDQQLGREVFRRLLSVRLDKLPNSVGSLASQLKAYESVRAFLTSAATQMLIDAPFAILFTFTLIAIAGWLALIPFVFLILSVWTGLRGLQEIESRSHQVAQANMRKTGLLVEAIEGAETLKSGQGGWRQLSLWQSISDTARGEELRLRRII